jgi:predicted nucleic acid-binding protein
MRVVLDTNVVLSGILWHGPAKDIVNLWLEGKLTLLYPSPFLKSIGMSLADSSGPKWNFFQMGSSSCQHE